MSDNLFYVLESSMSCGGGVGEEEITISIREEVNMSLKPTIDIFLKIIMSIDELMGNKK